MIKKRNTKYRIKNSNQGSRNAGSTQCNSSLVTRHLSLNFRLILIFNISTLIENAMAA